MFGDVFQCISLDDDHAWEDIDDVGKEQARTKEN